MIVDCMSVLLATTPAQRVEKSFSQCKVGLLTPHTLDVYNPEKFDRPYESAVLRLANRLLVGVFKVSRGNADLKQEAQQTANYFYDYIVSSIICRVIN